MAESTPTRTVHYHVWAAATHTNRLHADRASAARGLEVCRAVIAAAGASPTAFGAIIVECDGTQYCEAYLLRKAEDESAWQAYLAAEERCLEARRRLTAARSRYARASAAAARLRAAGAGLPLAPAEAWEREAADA